VLPLLAGLTGLILGPWLGVAVDWAVARAAARSDGGPVEPPVPAHRCPACGTGWGAASLVPMVGRLRRCPGCEAGPGRRALLVDAATVAIFATLAARFGADAVLVPYLALGAMLVVVSAVDAETHLLPNIIVWPSFLVGLAAVLALSGQRHYPDGVYSALAGAAVFTGFIGAAHIVNEAGMGLGDVKLSMTLGLSIGWIQPSLLDTTRLVLATIIVALTVGGVVGLAHNLIRRRGRAEIPFGPALAAATLVTVVASGFLPGAAF
jgi:leader peptidase (prepilin peptidase)/N-methyltransferase